MLCVLWSSCRAASAPSEQHPPAPCRPEASAGCIVPPVQQVPGAVVAPDEAPTAPGLHPVLPLGPACASSAARPSAAAAASAPAHVAAPPALLLQQADIITGCERSNLAAPAPPQPAGAAGAVAGHSRSAAAHGAAVAGRRPVGEDTPLPFTQRPWSCISATSSA